MPFDFTLTEITRGASSTEEAIGDWHYWVSRGYIF